MDQVLRASQKPILNVHQVPRHLFHPLLAWVDGYPGDLDDAALDLDDEEHQVPNRAEWAQGFHAEEVTGIKRVPVHLQELLPRSLLLPLWRRLDSFLRQNVRHRRPSDLDLQPRAKRVADLGIAPTEVLQGHLDHQLSYVPRLAWPPRLASGAVVLPRRQPAKPGQDRPRLDDLAALPSLLGAQLYAQKRQATTLIRGEGNTLFARGGVKDLLENPNLLQRVVELALQSLVDRRSDHRDEKLKRERKHWSPLWPFRHAVSSCESPRIYGRISTTAFRTARDPREFGPQFSRQLSGQHAVASRSGVSRGSSLSRRR